MLPLSHDEVVHGKGSLLGKMPGDDWQRFANLRLLYCYQFTLPGKKLLFMGEELAPWREWDHESSLDWSLSDSAPTRACSPWWRTSTASTGTCPPSPSATTIRGASNGRSPTMPRRAC